MTFRVNFERFQYFNLETNFLENENFFSKNWRTIFQLKALRLKTHHFHTKLPYQKPILRHIESWVQNGPISKNGVLPVTTFFLWKFCFYFRTSYKEWFDVPTTQMFIIVLFTSAGVLFDGAFSLRVSLTFFFHIHIETCVRLALHKKAIQRQSSSTSFTNHSENSPTRKLTRRTLNTETKLKSIICFFCHQKEYASNEKQLKGLTLHRVTTLNRDWSGSALLIWETPN